ncbi:alpha-ketoglutarate-dependent dioxygenase alkB homolog 4 [Parasteatoda tepidariorum]|uniref:alpha-ketoglutarate-dependent dioxygenase alkB homolog 4 n=1 Tax=Parasteatoda tepidariorum TaxID=114398 RepID=UPI001C71CC65|nr:alpha-ketoglutarate-dependent dioxygenase alkB homolog 4 [Parasteatoda tepidariorum]
MGDNAVKCGCKGIRTCLICEKEKGISVEPSLEEETVVYIYCPYCNLCWSEAGNSVDPLYIDKIALIPDFINKEEESYLVSSIDELPWMPSQSGRRKQDFGPKANFKKKKVKLGDFKGFPSFAKNMIERLHSVDDLVNFFPVELCHLEYTPDRGSSIQPHIDDLWLWGDRLVTINLLSKTILTLTPTVNSCLNCPEEMQCTNIVSALSDKFNFKEKVKLCNHQFNHEVFRDKHHSDVKSICSEYDTKSIKSVKPAVEIVLPPRSLFVLSGCARNNWFHEIKRQDVTSRRLAMTFRELSENFLTENADAEEICCKLLTISQQFCDFSKGNV